MKRLACVLAAAAIAVPSAAGAVGSRTFSSGSLIIPMDLAYQDEGLLQAYGLLFQLLRQGVPVSWVIEPTKTWHALSCDTAGALCAWDCAEEGSGSKCSYPTASPDFYTGATVLWDDAGGAPGTIITRHGYRGGPFVIDAADRDRALAIINAWNDPSLWSANPWAQRTVFFHVVSVHEATEAFTAYVKKDMVAAPTIAVFADGNEDIATLYLRAAGIKQSNGFEFPSAKCGSCGAGTNNPDMLTVPSVAGDMGTCDAPNNDHRNGQLFRDGVPAYCQIMSMHWDVSDRETVQCGGGACPASPAMCPGEPITYHGHEVVAEVRAFLDFPVHFFAECQAVNAYENLVPNPAWPFRDDPQRLGHFLTTIGTPPTCSGAAPCTDGDFECVVGGCDNGTRDCCQPRDDREKGAGFLIAPQPNANELKILHPEVPYNQLDGEFANDGGSEPAYNLSTYLNTMYKNNLDVTFITGPLGPGVEDVWMTGFRDGDCDIIVEKRGKLRAGTNCGGKVSYLGGHDYTVNVPVSSSPLTQGTRLFLNALFEADCVTTDGQPVLTVTLTGDIEVPADDREGTYVVGYNNTGTGTGLDGVLSLELPAGVSVVDAGGGTVNGSTVSWDTGAIGGVNGTTPASAQRTVRLAFADTGVYTLSASLDYTVGVTRLTAGPVTLGIGVGVDPPGGGGDSDGCDCRVGSTSTFLPGALALLALILLGRGVVRRRC